MTETLDDQPTQRIGNHEHCDRCNSQARVQVVMISGFDLFFCAHHFVDHEMTLIADNRVRYVVDERYLLKAAEGVR